MSTVPNGFSESWYVKTQRELGELQQLTKAQQQSLDRIEDGQERMEQRLDAHGARLAQVAMGAVIAALVIPMIPELISLTRDSSASDTSDHSSKSETAYVSQVARKSFSPMPRVYP